MDIPDPDPMHDGHVHTLYSDGSASAEQMIYAAIDRGLTALAFTDHMPLPESRRYAMPVERLAAYRQEVGALRSAYAGRIDIRLGLEIEYLPEEDRWCRDIAAMGWERLVGSVHRLPVDGRAYLVNGNRREFARALEDGFAGDLRQLVEAYFAGLRRLVDCGLCQVVGHLDVVKKHLAGRPGFSEDRPWYRRVVMRTVETIAAAGLAVEINASGLFQPPQAPYPSRWIIDACRDRRIPLVFGSDAHRPERVGAGFVRACPTALPRAGAVVAPVSASG